MIEKIQATEGKTKFFVANRTKIFKTKVPPLESGDIREGLRFLAPVPGKILLILVC